MNIVPKSWAQKAERCRVIAFTIPHLQWCIVPKLTPARAKAQRDRILDAALTCFARQGFHAATMQDIVGESGLSPGAIYGYFAGKTDMVTAIASERHQMERRRMEYALTASSLEASLLRLLE